jgi:hypothetical protein
LIDLRRQPNGRLIALQLNRPLLYQPNELSAFIIYFLSLSDKSPAASAAASHAVLISSCKAALRGPLFCPLASQLSDFCVSQQRLQRRRGARRRCARERLQIQMGQTRKMKSSTK